MAMEKVEYSFPHEDEDEKVIEVEPSSAEEIKKAKKEEPEKVKERVNSIRSNFQDVKYCFRD